MMFGWLSGFSAGGAAHCFTTGRPVDGCLALALSAFLIYAGRKLGK